MNKSGVVKVRCVNFKRIGNKVEIEFIERVKYLVNVDECKECGKEIMRRKFDGNICDECWYRLFDEGKYEKLNL